MPVKTSKLKTRYFKLHQGTLEDKKIEQIVSGRKLTTTKKMIQKINKHKQVGKRTKQKKQKPKKTKQKEILEKPNLKT